MKTQRISSAFSIEFKAVFLIKKGFRIIDQSGHIDDTADKIAYKPGGSVSRRKHAGS